MLNYSLPLFFHYDFLSLSNTALRAEILAVAQNKAKQPPPPPTCVMGNCYTTDLLTGKQKMSISWALYHQ